MAKTTEKTTLKAKRNLAQQLYINSDMTQKDIAAYVGTTETTMCKWVEVYGWKEQKEALQVSSRQVVLGLYQELLALDKEIKSREEKVRYATSKEADARMKIIRSIQLLQKDVMLPQYVQVMIAFTEHLQQSDLQMAKTITPYITEFLNVSAIKLENNG